MKQLNSKILSTLSLTNYIFLIGHKVRYWISNSIYFSLRKSVTFKFVFITQSTEEKQVTSIHCFERKQIFAEVIELQIFFIWNRKI